MYQWILLADLTVSAVYLSRARRTERITDRLGESAGEELVSGGVSIGA